MILKIQPGKSLLGLTRALAVIRGVSGGKPLRVAVRRHTRQGDAQRDLRNWDEARQAYLQALQLDPSLVHIWVQYGHALKATGQIMEALEAYEHSLALDSSLADTHLQFGHVLKLQGRLHEAALAYARSFELDPHSPHAFDELRGLGFAPPDEMPKHQGEATDFLFKSESKNEFSVSALLEQNGLLPAFLDRFDVTYYAETQGLDPAVQGSELRTCLTHFCTVGLKQGADINERDHFDADFYRTTYNDTFAMSPADAYRHWLNHGLSRGWAPSLSVWLQDTLGTDLGDTSAFDLDYYQASSSDLAGLRTTDLMTRFADGGLLEPHSIPSGVPTYPEGYIALARRAMRGGNPQFSIQILEWILARVPDHAATLQDYADRLTDTGQSFKAQTVYKQIIEDGRHNRWTHLLSARNLGKQTLFYEAVTTLTEGMALYPQYPELRRARSEVIDQFFQASVKEYETLSRLGRITDGQSLIADYGRVVSLPLSTEQLSPRPIRSVALFGVLELPQCRFYRIDQKIEQLERAGFKVTLYDSRWELRAFLAAITEFEAVIFYRVAPLPNIVPAIQAANELGLATFYEIDDLLFIPEEYPGKIEGYAGQISPETFAMLAMGVPLFAAAMRMCRYALASTPSLARAMAPFVSSGLAFVHRNGMGHDHERYLDYVPRQSRQGPVVLFYGSGTRAHKEDYQRLLEPALIQIAERHGERVAIVLVGWLPVSDALRRSATSLTVIEPSFDLHGYWDLLKEADINLAVLSPSLNVDCKSEIKWMEAAMFGIPSVVSRTATYTEVVREGETGFLCDTVDDWVRTLDRLIRNPKLRLDVGLRAQEVVRRDYCTDAMSNNIRDILEKVSPPKPAPRQKILVVNVFYAPQTFGGATRVMHDNITYMAARYGSEFDFEVFTAVDEAGEDYVVNTYAQDGVRVTGVTRSVDGEKTDIVSDPKMEEIFRHHLKISKPDLIHFHCIQRLSLAVVLVALDLEIPYVITAHDAWWISDNQFLLDKSGRETTYNYIHPLTVLTQLGAPSFARMQALRPALFGARHVLGVSDSFSDRYAHCGVPNVRALSNGVSKLPSVTRSRIPAERVTLGHVGGMVRHKGFHLLRQVLVRGQFAHLQLLVVDHSKEMDHEHQEMWGTTPVRVVGKVPQAEVSALYGQIDVLVAPSLWSESVGLATREAQVCGCWIVASDRGAIGADITQGVNGHRVDVSSLDGLSNVLGKIDQSWQVYRQSPPALPVRSAELQGDELAAIYRDLRAESRNKAG